MIKKNTCHCCLGKNNKKLLIIKNFPTQTVNNSPQRNLIGLKKKINLVLYLCLNCKNIFYSHKFTYSNLYNNFNSRPFNYKNIEQYKFYFNKLKKLANLSSTDLIYDIGKNNYNLKKILLVGNKIAYFDPRKKNFNSNLSFSSTKKKNNKTVIKPKIINSYNFIGNILNIDNFFFNIKKILHPKGVIGLYFHYGPSIIKKFSLDKIYLRIGEDYTTNSEYRFIANLLTVTRKSGEIGNDLKMFNFDLDRIFNVVGKDFMDIVNGKARDDLNNRTDVLGDFINKNITNILAIKDGKVTSEPRNSLMIRAEVDEGIIWISSSAMKDYLRDIKLGAKEFEMRLERSGILKDRIKKQMAAGWKDAIGSHNVQAYKIEMDISYLFNEKETNGNAAV